MKPKHFLAVSDWTPEDIQGVLKLAHGMKADIRKGPLKHSLAGKTLALLFEKSSLRTRASFEVAMTQLGGATISLPKSDVDLGSREPVKDGARVLSRYVDGIAARVFAHATLEELAAYSTVPVINALSDCEHPCQALADIMTVEERFPNRRDVTVAFIGDANNVARSLALICAKLGYGYRIAAPKGYQFDKAFCDRTRALAMAGGTSFQATDSPAEAAAGAHVLYTDTWISMGQEDEAEKRKRDFRGYCIDARLSQKAAKDHIVLHCLPAYRGSEITDEVIEGPHSAVFDQAENRLHTQRALLHILMGG